MSSPKEPSTPAEPNTPIDPSLRVLETTAEIFADPVGYLAGLGIDAVTVGDIGLPVAA